MVNLPLKFWNVGRRKLITWSAKEVVTWFVLAVMAFNGCFPLCRWFRRFRSEFKWKGRPLRFLLTGIFGITSGGGPHISVGTTEIPVFHFWQTGSLPYKLGNSEKEVKMTRAISIGWPGLIGKCRSIFLRYSYWFVTGQFAIVVTAPNKKGRFYERGKGLSEELKGQ